MSRLPHEDWRPFSEPIHLPANRKVAWLEDDDGYLIIPNPPKGYGPPAGMRCYSLENHLNVPVNVKIELVER